MCAFMESVIEFHESIKKIPAIRQYYSIPGKTEEIFGKIKSKSFDWNDFARVFKTSFNYFKSVYLDQELAWSVITNKSDRSNIINSTLKIDNDSNRRLFEYSAQLSDSDKGILIDTQCMLLASIMIFEVGQELPKSEHKEPDNGIKSFYRGLSDYNYGLLPTMLRNVKTPPGGIIDYNFVIDSYKKSNLEKRYTDRINKTINPYEYCAFMQHAREYSPLLDFTEDKNIAISFACSNVSNYNSYLSNDAAVLKIMIPETLVIKDSDTCDALIKSIDIFKCKTKKLTYSTIIRGKPLALCTPNDFDVQASVIDLKTNDRMRYQKGCFLLFTKAVITSDDVLIPIGLSTSITKHRIKNTNKKMLYESIEKNMHWLDVDHLMNPYKYFAEAPIEW